MKEETLEFTLQLKTRPVVLDGKKYTLSELSGQTRDAYLSKSSSNLVVDETGKATGLKTFMGHQSDLLSQVLTDEHGTQVPATTIDAWPASVSNALFRAARELNGLLDGTTAGAKKGEEAAKKD